MTYVFRSVPTKGVNFDTPPYTLGEDYATLQTNIRVRYNKAIPRPGTVGLVTPNSDPIIWIGRFVSIDGTGWTCALSTVKLYRLVSGTWTVVTSTPGNFTGSGNWSVCSGEGWLFWTRNGAAGVYGWDGKVADAVTLLSDDTAAGTFASAGTGVVATVPSADYCEYYSNRLYLIAPTESGTYKPFRVRFSSLASIGASEGATGNATLGRGDWDATGTLGSSGGGFVDIYDPDGQPLVAGKVLNNKLVLYKRRAIIDLTVTGTTPIHVVDSRISGVGCLCPFTLISTGASHVFLSEENVWAWDSNSLNPIGDRIRSFLEPYINHTSPATMIAGISTHRTEYYLILDSSLKRVLVYDYYRDTWCVDEYNVGPETFVGIGEGDVSGTTVIWSAIVGTWAAQNASWIQYNTQGTPVLFFGGGQGDTFYHSDNIFVDNGFLFDCIFQTGIFYDLPGGPLEQSFLNRLFVQLTPQLIGAIYKLSAVFNRGDLTVPSTTDPTTSDLTKGRTLVDFNQAGEGVQFNMKINRGGFGIERYAYDVSSGGTLLP